MNVVLRPFISLCSGAGGLDLGVERALCGAQPVVYVEHEVTACEVLAARIADGALHDAPIWTDLHTFDGRPWRGLVEGIIGGYPCQPFSVAGKRLGTADPRHLWPSIERIIQEVGPRWCFFENVAGHLRLGYHDVVRPDLERLGYRVAEGIFTAAEVGAPHRRERLFILAHRDERPRHEQQQQARSRHADGRSGDVADAAHDHGWSGERGAEAGTWPDGERRGRPASASRALGDAEGERPGYGESSEDRERRGATTGTGRAFPPGPGDTAAWQRILRDHPDLAPAIEPALRGVADGVASGLDIPRAARLRLTGNGVVPAQAERAFRTLWRQLADAGHTQNARDGMSKREEAHGRHAVSLHHAVAGWEL